MEKQQVGREEEEKKKNRKKKKKKCSSFHRLFFVFSVRASNFLDLLVSVSCGQKEEVCSGSMRRREASSGWEG